MTPQGHASTHEEGDHDIISSLREACKCPPLDDLGGSADGFWMLSGGGGCS